MNHIDAILPFTSPPPDVTILITMEICGEFFKWATDKDLYAYFQKPYWHFFPKLWDRTLFVRPAANLWLIKAAIQARLTIVSGQAQAPVQIIDTLPVPLGGYTRSVRDRCFKPEVSSQLLQAFQGRPVDAPGSLGPGAGEEEEVSPIGLFFKALKRHCALSRRAEVLGSGGDIEPSPVGQIEFTQT